MPEKVAKRISEAFKGVASFSTRDQNTHDFVASLTDADIEDNLDPVLIYNFDDELEDVEMPRVPEHYCVIYSYYNRIHTREEIREITQFCRKHCLTPVAVGAPQFWIENYIVYRCKYSVSVCDINICIKNPSSGWCWKGRICSEYCVLFCDDCCSWTSFLRCERVCKS